jgi:branched-chain amino acid transport system ATP-binding protein
VPLAYYSDRIRAAALAVIGAAIWAVFGLFTAFVFTTLMLVIVRSIAGVGRAVITPTHNSLLADYYPPDVRPDVFGFPRSASRSSAFVGPLVAGFLGQLYNWRVPFVVFVIPSIVFVIMGLRLKEPGRGHWERASAGASAAVVGTDEVPPSFAESVRILWQVGTLRRIWYSLPFLAAAFIGLVTLTSLYYNEVFGLDEFQRGLVAALAEPAQIVAILLGIPLASRLMLRDPGSGLRMLAVVGTIIGVAWTVFALSPYLWLAIVMHACHRRRCSSRVSTRRCRSRSRRRSVARIAMAALFIVPGLSRFTSSGIADAMDPPLLIVAPSS